MSYASELHHIYRANVNANDGCDKVNNYVKKIQGKANAEDILGLYVVEVWNFEQRMGEGESLEVVERLIEGQTSMEELVSLVQRTHGLNAACAERQLLKVQNILSATRMVLDPTGLSPSVAASFTIGTVKKLHCMLMKGLYQAKEEALGEFRRVDVKPRGSWSKYLPYQKIEQRLQTLLEVTIEVLAGLEVKDSSGGLAVAAIFLEQFLQIHPFVNGNGRLARLLFTMLLRDRFPVPLSLQKHTCKTYEQSRMAFIQALEDSRTGDAIARKAIINYVEEAVGSFLYDLYWCYVL